MYGHNLFGNRHKSRDSLLPSQNSHFHEGYLDNKTSSMRLMCAYHIVSNAAVSTHLDPPSLLGLPTRLRHTLRRYIPLGRNAVRHRLGLVIVLAFVLRATGARWVGAHVVL